MQELLEGSKTEQQNIEEHIAEEINILQERTQRMKGDLEDAIAKMEIRKILGQNDVTSEMIMFLREEDK